MSTAASPSSTTGRVRPDQRYIPSRRCPICGGSANDPRGDGSRCIGFSSDDGEFARCSREEYAGSLQPEKTGCYAHKLKGECKCGRTHGAADIVPYPRQDSRPSRRPSGGAIAQIYDYTDGTGETLFQALKMMGKGFRQRRPDPDRPGEWINNLEGVKTVLYRLPDVVSSEPSVPVWVVEGEKDVETLRGMGLIATTCPMGGGPGKWRPEFSHSLRGRHLILCGDNDRLGREHMKAVAESCRPLAASIRLVDLAASMKAAGLADLAEKGDVSDFVAMGGTLELLLRFADAAPDPSKPVPPTDEELGIVCLDDVEEQEVVWLWKDRIPLGKLTLLAGEGEIGKSFATLDLIARLSTGRGMPDSPDVPSNPCDCIFVTAEDGIADTIKPRLRMMAADMKRVFTLALARSPNGKTSVFTIADIDRLDAIMAKRPGIKLIVIDPISAFLGGVDENKNAELRGLLGPLSEFSDRHAVSIVAITHFGKTPNPKAASRILGSVAYSNAARVAWCVVPDPGNRERRLMLRVKNNLSPNKTGMAYEIRDGRVEWEPTPIDLVVNEILEAESSGKRKGPPPVKSVKFAEWLFNRLKGEPEKLHRLIDAARDDDLLQKPSPSNLEPSRSALYEAKKRIPSLYPGWSVEEFEVEGDNRRTYKHWRLSHANGQDHDDKPSPNRLL